MAWSPASDEYIASCSVDTTVVVWNTRRWHERVAVLRGHQGFVKVKVTCFGFLLLMFLSRFSKLSVFLSVLIVSRI